MALCVWSLAAGSAASASSGAFAQARSINIPAGPLEQSIRLLSEQTGISVGFSGRLPAVTGGSVRGARSDAEALRQLLKGSGYRAVRTGSASFRIEPIAVPVPKARVEVAHNLPPREPPGPEIIVTALKRSQPLSTLPATDRVLDATRLRSTIGVPQTESVGQELPSLSLSGMGAGRNRLFIRGIGDGPLNGFNQGSVAVFLDEGRLNYDAPDPDWALVDIRRVEVLEGPQGPLYGTGALGGILKISTNRPDLLHDSASLSAGLGLTEDVDESDSQSGIINAVLKPGVLAVRAVGYRERQGGWIDDAGGPKDSNRERLAGIRLGLAWVPLQGWTIDLTAALQNRRTSDSQYVDGDLGPLERPNRLWEPSDLDAKLGMLTINGTVGKLDLTSITSFSRQEAVASYDATPLAWLLGTTGPTLVRDSRDYSLFDQEIRVQNAHSGPVNWLAGISFIDATTNASIVATDPTQSVSLMTLNRSVTEAAGYAQASVAVSPALTLGGGARIFSSGVDDDAREGNAQSMRGQHDVRASGDASLTWRSGQSVTIYLRGATAYRPGGINPEPEAAQAAYQADELISLELGSRLELGRALSADATLYATRWQHVQADELLANGLVATRNAGNARNIGAEANLRWTLAPGLVLTSGLVLQSARLEVASRAPDIDDPRLPAVPQTAARMRLDRSFQMGDWRGNAGLGFRFSGGTHLSFDPVLDRRTPAHGTLDGSLSLARNGWTVSLAGQNLTNSSANTFAFGNPYRVRTAPERTPLQPRTISISLGRSF